MPKRPKSRAKPARVTTAKKAKGPVTSRQLLRQLANLEEQRGIDHLVLLGCLCEVIAGHQPTARRAATKIEALLDAAGIR